MRDASVNGQNGSDTFSRPASTGPPNPTKSTRSTSPTRASSTNDSIKPSGTIATEEVHAFVNKLCPNLACLVDSWLACYPDTKLLLESLRREYKRPCTSQAVGGKASSDSENQGSVSPAVAPTRAVSSAGANFCWHDKRYKVKMCWAWQGGHGRCKFGQDCTYAHGGAELQYWRHASRQGDGHGYSRGEASSSSAGPGMVRGGSASSNAPASPSGQQDKPYKVTMCRAWEWGRCTYAPDCIFAHGGGELQFWRDPAREGRRQAQREQELERAVPAVVPYARRRYLNLMPSEIGFLPGYRGVCS